MSQAPPPHDVVDRYIATGAAGLAFAGATWAAVRWPIRWFFRRIIEQEFAKELQRSADNMTEIAAMDRVQAEMWRVLKDTGVDMEQLKEDLSRVGEMQKDAALAKESAQRTEAAIERMGTTVQALAVGLGEIRGEIRALRGS